MKRMTLKMMAEDFGKTALNLGRADENKAVRIEIDLSNLLEITPDANASVTVETPSGKKYPATTSKEGKLLIWDVNSADTAEEGRGWAQLTITGSNDEVLKSVVTATRVGRSIRGEGTAPDPVQNWVDDATSKLGNVVSAGENAKEAAKRANDAAEKAENGGGVQSDYTQNDATQPDYIKNRPGGYYQTLPGVGITWDGVIGDRPKAQTDEGVYLVKVSDEVLTTEQLIGATVTMVDGSENTSMVLLEDNVMSGDGVVMETEGAIISCSKTTFEIDGWPLTLPETGTYFVYREQGGNKMYVSSLTKPETQELVPIPGELTNIKGGYDLAGKKVLLPKEYVEQPKLSNVAYSGDYSDLLNKPTLAAVATSGDFNDLSNKPAMLTPNSRNYDAAYFTKSSKEMGWLSVYPTIEYNQTSGKFYKNPWETNGLSGNDIPSIFWTSMTKKLDGMQSVGVLDCLLRLAHTGATSSWGIIGLAFTSYGIYEVTSNSILLSESEGLFLEFSPLQTMVLRSSTAGSTKKFKITVDDTGTLSATEVTT